MKPKSLSFAPRYPWRAFCTCVAVGTVCLGAAVAAPSLPTSPAALVERPLTPASNDNPDEAPSLQHVWVPGHWRWVENSYVWVAGDWQLPPASGATWVAPQWEMQGNGYALREGYWQQGFAANVPGNPLPNEIAAPQPPPPPRPETILERPTPAHVWLPGYWDWRDNQFRWIDGHWETPSRPNLTWIPPRWESRGDRYVLVAGYWRDPIVMAPAPVQANAVPATSVVVAPAAPPQVVVVSAPPPPRNEVVYVQPTSQHVWVPGYWVWRGGRHVWVAGHWERPPRGHATWVQPQWERRGNAYVFIDGHWR